MLFFSSAAAFSISAILAVRALNASAGLIPGLMAAFTLGG